MDKVKLREGDAVVRGQLGGYNEHVEAKAKVVAVNPGDVHRASRTGFCMA